MLDKTKQFLIKHPKNIIKAGKILALVAIFSIGLVGGLFYSNYKFKQGLLTQDPYVNFVSEVYDSIQKNYWEKITDQQLSELFRLGTEKIANQAQTLAQENRRGVALMVKKATLKMSEGQKKQFVTDLTNIVLYNLKPFGRNQLYSQKQETQLRETVSNIDKSADLYQFLGLDKTASQQDINKAYEQKKADLAPQKNTSSLVAQELAQAERAFQALSKPESREIYDQTGIEPTVIAKLITPDILDLKMTKLSPQTFDEFQKTLDQIDKTTNASSLILDLRDNIGGAIDLLQYFLGPFIGQNQYAYEFFHQDLYQPFKTLTGWLPSLVRYKKVVVLVDAQTQSSAELMASVLKKYNVGILVGTKTKGWGTVENVFPLKQQLDTKEKYSLFIAHSLTLRDDNQPIEGNGVEPVIKITDSDWQDQLYQYLPSQELVNAVKTVLKE